MLPYRDVLEITSLFLFSDKSSNDIYSYLGIVCFPGQSAKTQHQSLEQLLVFDFRVGQSLGQFLDCRDRRSGDLSGGPQVALAQVRPGSLGRVPHRRDGGLVGSGVPARPVNVQQLGPYFSVGRVCQQGL